MVGHQLPSPGNTLASNPNLASQSQALTGNFSKSHAFDFKHGSAIERSQDDRESVTHASPAIKLMAPPAAKVIRGHSPYGNFLADEPDEGKIVKSMSNLSTTKQTTGQMTQQASAENSWLTDGGGRERCGWCFVAFRRIGLRCGTSGTPIGGRRGAADRGAKSSRQTEQRERETEVQT